MALKKLAVIALQGQRAQGLALGALRLQFHGDAGGGDDGLYRRIAPQGQAAYQQAVKARVHLAQHGLQRAVLPRNGCAAAATQLAHGLQVLRRLGQLPVGGNAQGRAGAAKAVFCPENRAHAAVRHAVPLLQVLAQGTAVLQKHLAVGQANGQAQRPCPGRAGQ